MSDLTPDAVSTSVDKRSHRPNKKRALTPVSKQSAQVEALFKNPDREIKIPTGPQAKFVAPPPEIVANVQGSSAGAGSGEFHVYKASRRREYERQRLMDEEVANEKADEEFKQKQEELKKLDDEKLNKNRAKREKQKLRKQKAANYASPANGTADASNSVGTRKQRLGPARTALGNGDSSQMHLDDAKGGSEHIVEESVGIVIHDDD